MRSVAVLAAVAVVLLPAPAADAGSLVLRDAGPAADVPRADGRTIVAWAVAPGQVRTLDAAGRRRDVALPPSCTGHVVAAGAGRLLVQCPVAVAYPPPPQPYVVLHVASGRTAAIAVPNPYAGSASGARPEFTALGRHWLGGYVSFHRGFISYFFNWRTGRAIAGDRDPFPAARWLDLDASSLARPLCRPHARRLQRQNLELGEADRFSPPPHLEGGWVLGRRTADGLLGIGRCGSRLRPFGGGAVREATLGGGLLSWRAPRRRSGPLPWPTTTMIRRVRDGRRWQVGGTRDVVHRAGRTLVAARWGAGGYRVLVARVPRR